MPSEIINFSRHKGTKFGHIKERMRCGYPSRYRVVRKKVELIDGKWIDENGRDVHDAVTVILLRCNFKSLGLI